MAGNRIKGITIEIGGNTTKLTDSLKSVDKSLKDTQSKLKDVNKLLKMDPSNVELLRQKHDLLTKAVEDTKKRQEELKKALENAKNAGDTKYSQEQQDALQRELIETTQNLKALQDELNHSSPLLESISAKTGEWSEKTRAMSTAAAAGAGALVGMAYSAATTADDLATLARNTGFSVEELQKMQYASGFIDVSMETMTGSIMKLTKNMASGSDAFETLGVSITDADGNMRDATDVWYDSIAALSKVTNETERDQLAMELFGKSAMDLAGVVDDGGEALKQFGQEAEDAGLILSGDAVSSAVEFNDQIDKLKASATQAFLKAGAALSTTLIPNLEKLVDLVVQVLSWFANLDGSTQALILTILGLTAAISPVLGLISTLTGLATALNVATLPLIATIGAVILVIGLLVAAGVALYKNWDTVKAKVQQLWSSIQTAFNNIKTAVTNAVNNAANIAVTAFNKIYSTVTSVVNNVRNAVSSGFNAVVSTVSSAVNSAYSIVSSVFSSMYGAVSGAISGITGVVSSVFWGVYNTISSAINSAAGVVQGAVNTIRNAFNFSWSLPPLKIPHISVSGGVAPYGIGGKGSLPHFNISWYRKAYENAVLFNSPTVIPTINGMKGFGDGNGSELVIGTNKLRELVGAAGNNVNVNVYAAPGMNETAVANAVALKLDRWLGERV